MPSSRRRSNRWTGRDDKTNPIANRPRHAWTESDDKTNPIANRPRRSWTGSDDKTNPIANRPRHAWTESDDKTNPIAKRPRRSRTGRDDKTNPIANRPRHARRRCDAKRSQFRQREGPSPEVRWSFASGRRRRLGSPCRVWAECVHWPTGDRGSWGGAGRELGTRCRSNSRSSPAGREAIPAWSNPATPGC